MQRGFSHFNPEPGTLSAYPADSGDFAHSEDKSMKAVDGWKNMVWILPDAPSQSLLGTQQPSSAPALPKLSCHSSPVCSLADMSFKFLQ